MMHHSAYYRMRVIPRIKEGPEVVVACDRKQSQIASNVQKVLFFLFLQKTFIKKKTLQTQCDAL